MPEQFANNVQTTLDGAIAPGATSLVVTSAAGFPSAGPFRMLIDSELFVCTACSGTMCTVVPGAEGTTPTAHLTLAPVTLIVTAGALRAVQSDQIAPVTFTRATNTSSALYAIDGSAPDYRILHALAGPTSYVLPAPTDGRTLELQDITGAIETPSNNVFIVPHARDTINGSRGFLLSGSIGNGNDGFHYTSGSPTVTAPNGQFTSELAIGMSIASDWQPSANYIIASIESDTSLTLASNYTGDTTTQANVWRTSLTFAANSGRLSIQSDGTTWFIKGDGTPTRVQFVSSAALGTPQAFVPPAGVYSAVLVGCGQGGYGGTGGTTNKRGGGGGGGAIEGRVTLAVLPNRLYPVSVGLAPSTTFGDPALGGPLTVPVLFSGASSGANGDDSVEPGAGGLCVTAGGYGIHNVGNGLSTSAGGNAIPGGDSSSAGGQMGASSPTVLNYDGNVTPSAAHGTYGAGASGGAGPRGPGGIGGDGSADAAGLAGVNAPDNSGAGGGGGGSGPTGGGAGGAAGSGYLDVIYVL